jgi:hypothetical protein
MNKRILMLTASVVLLACGSIPASAQDNVPGAQTQDQPQILMQRQDLERLLQRLQSMRRGGGGDDNTDQGDGGYRGGGMGPRWRLNQDWDRGGNWDRGGMGRGMMGREGAAGGPVVSGMMMRMLFSLMDSDGDGTVSLQEFQAAHERIFRAMDANKDGKLTLEEIQAFMQARRPAQRQ